LFSFQQPGCDEFFPKFGPVDWLGDEHPRSQAARLFKFFRRAGAGDDYDRDGTFGFGSLGAKPTEKFEAAKPWHVNVQKYDIGDRIGCPINVRACAAEVAVGFEAVAGDPELDVSGGALESLLGDGGRKWVVVDQQQIRCSAREKHPCGGLLSRFLANNG